MYPYQVADNLWILGNDYFHCYLIKSNHICVLVEMGISAIMDILLEQLSDMGGKPDFLIVTHPHSDHITGLDYLRHSFPKAKVIAGKGAESFISHPKAIQSMIVEDQHMKKSIATRGIFSQRPVVTTPPSLSGCTVMNDDEELNLGELNISFLEAKGHSPGNILVHIPCIKTTLASDSLGNLYPGRGFFPTFFTGFNDYLDTIDRLAKMDPMILGLAHHGLFLKSEEIKEKFQDARRAANDVKNYILSDKRNEKDIAKDLFEFYYRDELTIYSPQNILNCCCLLVRRIREL